MALATTARWFLAAFTLVAGLGCIISPKPEPPQATFDVTLVDTTPVYGPTIVGGAGAAGPAGATVWGVNLDRNEDPANGVVREDGSFEIELPVDVGEEVRLGVVSEGGRTGPVDIIFGTNAPTPTLAPRPLADCLFLVPEAVLDPEDGSTISIENQCTEDVHIEEPRLRRPTPGLTVGAGGSWPAILASGESLEVRVDVGAELVAEEVVFIEASAPERDRRPVTVLPR